MGRNEGGRNRSNNDDPTSPPQTPNQTIIISYEKYMECKRNIAERIGGCVYDGCREFVASGAEGTPAALICAACQCNRSFHKTVIHTEVINLDRAHNPPPPPPAAAPEALPLE